MRRARSGAPSRCARRTLRSTSISARHLRALGQIPQALAAFREAAARRPGFVEAHLGAARASLDLEQLPDAVRQFEAAIAADKGRADAHRGLGATHRRTGDHAAAATALLAATRLDASDGEALLWLADSRYRLGQRDDALSDVRQAILRRPEDAAAHALHGVLLARQNRHAEAIASLEESLRLTPVSPEAPETLFELGTCRQTLGKLDLAEQAFSRAAALAPKEARFREALGRLYLQLGRHEEAVEALERADHLRAGNVETLRALGYAYLLFDSPREAQRTLEKALAVGPPLAETHLHHARALVALSRAADARRELEAALARDPGLAEAHFDLGVLLAKAGDLEPAAQHLEEATRTALDPADAYGELARVRRARGEIHEALLAWKQRLRARPGDAEAHFGLAEALSFAQRDADAVHAQQAGMALDPKRAGASRRLGEMLVRLGRHDEALDHLEDATREEPHDPALWSTIASCHERAEDPKHAVVALLEAVAVLPDDASLLRRLGVAQRKLGQEPAAIARLTRALALDAGMVDLEVPLGEMLRAAGRRALEAGEHAEAAALLEKARLYQRDDVELCVEHATALRALGRHAEAAAAARRGTELAPERADVLHLLGELSEKTGEHEAARSAYERVVRLSPDRLSAQLGLGLAWMRLGQDRGGDGAARRAPCSSRPRTRSRSRSSRWPSRPSGAHAEARDALLRLTKLRPLDAEPLRRLAACRLALGEDLGRARRPHHAGAARARRSRRARGHRQVPGSPRALRGQRGVVRAAARAWSRSASRRAARSRSPTRSSSATTTRSAAPGRCCARGPTIRSCSSFTRAPCPGRDVPPRPSNPRRSWCASRREASTHCGSSPSPRSRAPATRAPSRRWSARWPSPRRRRGCGRSWTSWSCCGPPRWRPPETTRGRCPTSSGRASSRPTTRRGRSRSGAAFHALGRSQEALDALRQNLKTHPTHGGSLLLLRPALRRGGLRQGGRRRLP